MMQPDMIPFDPANWYWFVGGDRSRLWSSAAGAYVSPDDKAYLLWLGEGPLPSTIASDDELHEVLAGHGLADKAPAASPEKEDELRERTAQAMAAEPYFAVMLDLENRVRTLEGKPEITDDLYRDGLKARVAPASARSASR